MSLGQDEPIHTYTDQYTRHFLRDACYGGRVRANVQEFNSSLCTVIKTILQNQLKSDSQDICNLMQEYKTYIDVYEENYAIECNSLSIIADEDYRLTNKNGEQEYISNKLGELDIIREYSKIVGKNKDLLMALMEKSCTHLL